MSRIFIRFIFSARVHTSQKQSRNKINFRSELNYNTWSFSVVSAQTHNSTLRFLSSSVQVRFLLITWTDTEQFLAWSGGRAKNSEKGWKSWENFICWYFDGATRKRVRHTSNKKKSSGNATQLCESICRLGNSMFSFSLWFHWFFFFSSSLLPSVRRALHVRFSLFHESLLAGCCFGCVFLIGWQVHWIWRSMSSLSWVGCLAERDGKIAWGLANLAAETCSSIA